MYLAATVSTCIWERFGDDILNPGSPVPRSVWTRRQLSKIRVSKVRVCDLTDENVRAQVGVDLSALHHTDLSVPQAWGLAVQEHRNSFDGLLYPSRFDGQRCLALFDRPGLRDGLVVLSTVDLVASDEANAFLLEKQIALI
jgi:RES domain-containing protein